MDGRVFAICIGFWLGRLVFWAEVFPYQTPEERSFAVRICGRWHMTTRLRIDMDIAATIVIVTDSSRVPGTEAPH